MSSNENNIILPDGTNVQVPEWASETTMLAIKQQMKAISSFDSKLVKELKNYNEDADEIIDAVTASAKQDAGGERVDEKVTQSINKKTKTFGKNIESAAGFLKDTDAPLSGFIGAIREGGTAIAKAFAPTIQKLTDSFGGTAVGQSKFAEVLSSNSEVLTDAAFMWMGWNAGKLESFAAVQKQMIDNGAIIFETDSAFNTLRTSVNASGVTYDSFSKTIAANNSAITAFGGTTSIGTKRFQEFFSKLEFAGNSMGDFGLSNTELLQQTGEFLEYQRLIGGLARGAETSEAKLLKSFSDLQIETAGLASITGFQRSQILAARTQVENVNWAAGLQAMDGSQRTAADEARYQFELFGQAAGTNNPINYLSEALATSLAYAQGDMERLDTEAMMAGHPEALAAIRAQFGDDFIMNLENEIKSGNTDGVDAIIKDAFAAEATRIGTATASVNDQFASSSNDLAKAIISYQLVAGKLTPGDVLNAENAAIDALTKAGTTTVLLNDATIAFLKVQELATIDLDMLSSGLSIATQWLRSNVPVPVMEDDTPGPNPTLDKFSEEMGTRPVSDEYDISSISAQVDAGNDFLQQQLGTAINQLQSDQIEWDQLYADYLLTENPTISADEIASAIATAVTEDVIALPVNSRQDRLVAQQNAILNEELNSKITHLETTIAEEQDRVDRSNAGENEYWGSEQGGRYTSEIQIEKLQKELDELKSKVNNTANATPRMFGGPVDAGSPYVVGDGVDMRQAEMFVPEVNGRIMSNREINEVVNNDLTNQQETNIILTNLAAEYKMLIETKKSTLDTLTNLNKFAKSKKLSDRLNSAIDASGA